jgi:undecaprenyl diphosphate synthase
MTQSHLKHDALHVAVIMDGNGRWAQARGLPRSAGHRAGGRAVRQLVEAAPLHGIGTLTLYAFSSDNWQRPAPEVQLLMRLFERYLRLETARCVEHEVRLEVLGRRDRLAPRVRAAIEAAEHATAAGTRLRLRLAIDYSSRDAIIEAAIQGARSRADFAHRLSCAADRVVPDVDLVIRTGGEQRLSDFLLWESAYAELYFTDCGWPDFDAAALAAAVAEFSRRQRRFGTLSPVTRTVSIAS